MRKTIHEKRLGVAVIALLGAAVCCVRTSLADDAIRFVEYVESDGTQAVDTGFYATSRTRITADFAYGEVTKQFRAFGAASDAADVAFSCDTYINGNGYFAWAMCDGKGNWKATSVKADTVRHQLVLDGVAGTFRLTREGSSDYAEAMTTTRTKTSVWPLAIFAERRGADQKFSYHSKMRLYGFTIETNSVENGWVKVMDLRPVAFEDEGCLYDLVSGEVVRPSIGNSLTASSTHPIPGGEISRSTVSAAGEMTVFAKIDTMNGLTPCELTATVRDCVSGEEETRFLGSARDSTLHGYPLSGLTSDGGYEVTVRGSWPNLGSTGYEADLYVFQVSPAVDAANGSIYMASENAELGGKPEDWLMKSSGLRRLPQDGDEVTIGAEAGNYSLVLENVGARTFNGWTGAGAASVVGETTIAAGSILNVTNVFNFSANTPASKGSVVLDGGTLNIHGAFDGSNFYNNDTLTVRSGTLLRDGLTGIKCAFYMHGSSRVYIQGGTVTVNGSTAGETYGSFVFQNNNTPAIVQTGGTVSLGAISAQGQADTYYEISGGSLTVRTIDFGNRSGSTACCTTIRPRGSKFTFTTSRMSDAFNSEGRTLIPSFYDFRIRSDADAGAKGVGFISYTATDVKGAFRAIPDGGVAVVHTNLFPLVVQSIENALVFANDFKDGIASYRFMSTGLFDIGVPEGLEHMIRADLKPGAELSDGWSDADGVCAGFVKLPRILNPSGLVRADLKLKVAMLGSKTLASLKSDLEAVGFGPVTADETAADYNLVVGLPKDRLEKGFADSKVLIDFTTVTGAKDMQQNKVTTNALIQAVALDIRKPGLVLTVR